MGVRVSICRNHAQAYLPLVGQVGGNSKNKIKQKKVVTYNEQLHTVHVVRGPFGSVLLAQPMISESISAPGTLYADKFTQEQRDSVRFFRADKVRTLLTKKTRIVFPNIRGCAIDPLQLAFSAQKSTWNPQKRNELHLYIRGILSKFPALT